MKDQTIERPYVITYSNHLFFEGRKLAFRNKELFDITDITPIHVPRSDQGWWFKYKKLLTSRKAKELTKTGPVEVNITHLQWNDQEKLNHVFNLT